MALISSILNIGEKVIPNPQKVVQTQSTPDDKKVIQQIVSSHSPDANYAVEEKALLSMAQDILSQATPTLSPVISILPFVLYFFFFYQSIHPRSLPGLSCENQVPPWLSYQC